ncbi:MAG: SufD family Fe-S cluster assembly protein [Paludibacteraceae bacterium]|nr:SufD family Fe-S cluster assembly protein [Paludibacteraceae bacterium]
MLNLNKGEHKDLVFLNEPDLDVQITQQEGSSLRIVLVNSPDLKKGQKSEDTLSALHTIEVHQVGVNCQTEIYVLAYLKNKERVCTRTHVHHDVGEGVSKQVVKYVLEDEAQGEFLGELKILPDAQKVSAEQTNRNLLLSEKATMRTRPQLEIYADDVKATHGATTGQLDDSALFYMQQRGIDPVTARQMLVQAFMQDILNYLRISKKSCTFAQ